jgi:hypothetical protein
LDNLGIGNSNKKKLLGSQGTPGKETHSRGHLGIHTEAVKLGIGLALVRKLKQMNGEREGGEGEGKYS